jgi:alanine racemase
MTVSPHQTTDFDAAAAERHCPAMDKTDPAVTGAFEAACLTVRLPALAGNFHKCQRLASPAVVAGVVKADAYGLGLAPVAHALADAGCDTFFVARPDEGVALRTLVPRARIFVLDGAQPDMVPALIAQNLTPVLNSLAEIAAWSAAARATKQTLDAAVHIDTGMNRLGLPVGETNLLAAEAKRRLEGLRVVLWMSHLACSDEPDNKMNAAQLDRFKTVLAMLPEAPASLSASGGILLGKDYLFDMVRPGIALYGGNPHSGGTNPFAAVVRLTGTVMQLRPAPKGETVGYGASYRLKRPSLLATIGLGYADGILRSLASSGWVAIDGVKAPIVGRISMDLLTVDVTDLPPGLVTGAEAELFGDVVRLDEAAAKAGTISYEILTSLSRRARRRYEETP